MRNQTDVEEVGQKRRDEVEIIVKVIKMLKVEAGSIARKKSTNILVKVSKKEGIENTVLEADHERSTEVQGMIVQVVMII